jgi:hypothetical protein
MACDMSSTDGTAEVLEKYRSEEFSILRLGVEAIDDKADDEDTWLSHSLRRYKHAPADWVIFLDADEFWLPASGNLKECQAFQSADIVSVERLNVVLGPNGPLLPKELTPSNYDRALLFAKPTSDKRIEKQKNDDPPWIMGQVLPKIAARPSEIEGTTPGQHDALGGESLRRTRATDVVIAHLALSTPSRFERKVRNVRAIYEKYEIDLSDPDQAWDSYPSAWHWRRWATVADPRSEFESNVTNFDRIAELYKEGVIQSAREILADYATPNQSSRKLQKTRSSI